jgi:hypothetical protein
MSGADTDTARRLTRLAESSQLPAALARGVLFTGAALATLAVCLLPQRAATAPEALGDLLLPGWLSVLGAACLLGQAAAATRRAARAAGDLMREVAKKLVTQPLAGESADNGATWNDAGEQGASFPANRIFYALGGARRPTADGYVIGTFTEYDLGTAANPKVRFFKMRIPH